MSQIKYDSAVIEKLVGIAQFLATSSGCTHKSSIEMALTLDGLIWGEGNAIVSSAQSN